MVTLGELLLAEASLALARVAGFAAVPIGTAVLARFGASGHPESPRPDAPSA